MFTRSEVIVLTNTRTHKRTHPQTNKQTLLKTCNAFWYATTLGNNADAATKCIYMLTQTFLSL